MYSEYICTHTEMIDINEILLTHYNDVIMSAITSQITSLTIVYSTVYSDADQRKHQRAAQMASYAENVSIWWCRHALWDITVTWYEHAHFKTKCTVRGHVDLANLGFVLWGNPLYIYIHAVWDLENHYSTRVCITHWVLNRMAVLWQMHAIPGSEYVLRKFIRTLIRTLRTKV